MAGEATISGSQAALKVLYPNGEPPKDINEQYTTLKELKKETNFVGELAYVPIQNANPQGSSSTVANAQTALYQGNYVRFALTRVSHYGLARITGEAAEAAVKDEGALVDLWENETKGAAQTEMSVTAAYLFGTGDGVLGRGLSGASGTTWTLATDFNMNYLELNMLIGAVSATGLASTVRSGSARLTGIDRRSRTVTSGSAFTSQISGLQNTDYIVRFGDNHNAGARRVIIGLDEYVKGGTSPGTLLGLNRDSDPVRLAGQAIDYAGWAMEDAIVDASAQGGFHGVGYANVAVMNNLEFANMKKSLGAKIIYDRGSGGSKNGSHSFSEVSIEGENGPIRIIADPFCPRYKCFMLRMSDFSLFTLKGWPHIQKQDGLDFLRLSSDDAFEVRWVSYGNLKCKNPGPQVKLTSFGQ